MRDGDWVKLTSRAGETTLRALITERVAPGVVYTTFHHPDTQANVVTTDFSDWATNCPEYKVTAVQISPSNGPSNGRRQYRRAGRKSRRIAPWSKPRSRPVRDAGRARVGRSASGATAAGVATGERAIPEETRSPSPTTALPMP